MSKLVTPDMNEIHHKDPSKRTKAAHALKHTCAKGNGNRDRNRENCRKRLSVCKLSCRTSLIRLCCTFNNEGKDVIN